MTRATIIFANGSKQMARNLDDQMLRWHERRLAIAKPSLEPPVATRTEQPAPEPPEPSTPVLPELDSIAVRDCSHPADMTEAQAWRDELVAQKLELIARKMVYERLYIRQTLLKKGIAQIDAEIVKVNAYIRAHRENTGVFVGFDYLNKLRAENEALQARVAWLEAQLEQYQAVTP